MVVKWIKRSRSPHILNFTILYLCMCKNHPHSSGGCVNPGGGDAIITTTAALTAAAADRTVKTEYKSEQLATLLAASQEQQQLQVRIGARSPR